MCVCVCMCVRVRVRVCVWTCKPSLYRRSSENVELFLRSISVILK